MTQLSEARKGRITEEMNAVAEKEKKSAEFIRKGIKKGTIIIPANKNHLKKNLNPIGIGKGLTTKINANIGASSLCSNMEKELQKVDYCIKYGADTLMDLSTGTNLDEIRKAIIKKSSVPVGTVPIYQVAEEAKSLTEWTIEDYLKTIEKQAKQGVDYFTIHCGLLKEAVPLTKKRLTGVVSRGGSLMVMKMQKEKKENVLNENIDSILGIMKEYDVSMSLGDGLRPGSINDATDKAQLHELKILGALVKKCWKNNVQAMVEGPGHIPLHEIKKNVELEKEWCYNAPFYVLGPLVTDIGLGYDHVSSAIGSAVAGQYGADMLCYVTPKEHLGLPNLEDVKEGIIVHKIAAHAADLAKGVAKAKEKDFKMSKARFEFDWKKQFELSFDPEKAKKMKSDIPNADFCSMCGAKFCSMKNYIKAMKEEKKKLKKKRKE